MLLYYITDRKQFPGAERDRRSCQLNKIAEAVRCGVDYIQLREKDLRARELEQLAREAMERIAGTNTRLLINSRIDIALAVAAHGVHLRSKDISPEDVRKIWFEAKRSVPVIAVSCHTEEEVIAAKNAAADFVVFGPVFEKSNQPAIGLESLGSACRHNIPVLALGGTTLANARSCIETGAAGIAGIRLFQENEIEKIIKAFRA